MNSDNQWLWILMLKNLQNWKGIRFVWKLEWKVVRHTGMHLSSCPHRVSFLSSYLWIISGITWLLEKPVERLHWTPEFISLKGPGKGGFPDAALSWNFFLFFLTIGNDAVVRLGLEKFRQSCVCESGLLSAVGLKTNTVALWTLIPHQQWSVLGESLWQLLHTDMLVILCIFWQCRSLERTHSMNNS